MSGLREARAVSVSSAGYEDGLGRRSVRFDREIGGMLECLHLRAELWAFEPALRQRADAIGALDDERFVRVRGIERGPQGLVVISELVAGQRLIDILEARQKDDAGGFGIDAALGFLLRTLPALSTLHAISIAHGALAPGRIIITPASQVVLLDGIYGAALERLNLSRPALWSTLGVLALPFAGANRFDRRSDVMQTALCALTLALGRQGDGVPSQAELSALVDEVTELAEIRAGARFGQGVKEFFAAALPVHGRAPEIGTDEAVWVVQRLASLIGEDEAHAAFEALTRVEGIAYKVPALTADEDPSEDQEPFEGDEELDAAPATPVAPLPPAAPVPAKSPAPAAAVPTPAPIPRPAPGPAPAAVAQSPAPKQPAAPPAIAPPAVPVPVSAPAGIVAPPAPAPAAVLPQPTPASVAPPPAVHVPATFAAPPFAAPAAIAPPVVAPLPPLAPRPQTVLTPPPAPPPAPITIAVDPPAQLRVRAEPPSGYTPALAEPARSEPRALPFVGRTAIEEPRQFPWKAAAAAVVVLSLAGLAGWTFIPGAPSTASKALPAAAEPVAPAGTASATGKTGGLSIESQPAGASVLLDGTNVGVTPLKLESVAPGRHAVTITNGTATVKRTVRIEAGRALSMDVPIYSGWVSVFSPIPLDIASGGRTLGNTDTGKIMLPPGTHVLTLSNREFGFSENRTVEIYPGEERPLNIEPKGFVNVNAHPWAEVLIDGKKAGDTPIANLPVLLGTRVFVFRHPQYGERRVTETITAAGAALSIDLTKPSNLP